MDTSIGSMPEARTHHHVHSGDWTGSPFLMFGCVLIWALRAQKEKVAVGKVSHGMKLHTTRPVQEAAHGQGGTGETAGAAHDNRLATAGLTGAKMRPPYAERSVIHAHMIRNGSVRYF